MLHHRIAPFCCWTIGAILIPGLLHGEDPALGAWQGYWARSGDTLLVTIDIQAGDAPNRYRAAFARSG